MYQIVKEHFHNDATWICEYSKLNDKTFSSVEQVHEAIDYAYNDLIATVDAGREVDLAAFFEIFKSYILNLLKHE